LILCAAMHGKMCMRNSKTGSFKILQKRKIICDNKSLAVFIIVFT
jgi:hypothetical protein